MTVCSSPDLEALRLSGKAVNSSSGETQSEGRGGFKLGSYTYILLLVTCLVHLYFIISWLRVSRSRLLLSSSGGQRYLAQCGELYDGPRRNLITFIR